MSLRDHHRSNEAEPEPIRITAFGGTNDSDFVKIDANDTRRELLFEKVHEVKYGSCGPSYSGKTHWTPEKDEEVSRAEHTALQQLRKKLVEEEGYDSSHVLTITQTDLLRFLRVRFLDVKTASKSFADYLRWREHFCVDQLQVSDVIKELERGVLRLNEGQDWVGRSVLTLSVANCHPAETCPLSLARCLTFLMEKALASSSKKAPTCVGLVVDYTSARLEHCDVRVLRTCLDLLHHRYPQQLGYMLICRPPAFFPQVWDALSPYTQPWIMAKIHIMGTSCYERLVEYIPPEYIPHTLGGKLESPHLGLVHQVHVWGAEENLSLSQAAAPQLEVRDKSDLSYLALASSSLVVKVGIMVKQGGKVKSWKKRSFVLTSGGHLYYFKSVKAMEPKGVILLNNRCRAGVDIDGRDKLFALETPKRTWQFSCKNRTEKQEWIHTLNTLIAKLSYGNSQNAGSSFPSEHLTHI